MNSSQTSHALPNGFLCSGMAANIKEEKNRKDLGLIFVEKDAVLGGIYTQNKFPSAHVQYCRSLTPSNQFRALIVNSGNANAATGQQGLEANQQMASLVAEKLKIQPHQVFTSSTGIIGRPFPIDKIENSLDQLINNLSDTGSDISQAIMTTDTVPKLSSSTCKIGNREYSVVGFAKGSGMIHPNMATMLAYILTDAPIPFSQIQVITSQIAERSFNCISVDGDTSTNDSFYLISSNATDSLNDSELTTVTSAIRDVAISLSQKVARDGEGAEHLVEVTVSGSPSYDISKSALNAILTSNLVKTAINGKDPNWGRILMAVGNSQLSNQIKNNHPISIDIQSVPVFTKGEPVIYNEAELSGLMSKEKVTINVDLHLGNHKITGWGCDFSEEYVKINADYST